MNLKEHYKARLSNLLSEEKAKKKSLEAQSDVALGDLEGLLSNAHDRMKGSKDPRVAAQHKKLADHFMDAYNHHMVGEYDKAIEVARRGVASHAIKHK
jgi:hypothetical protein